MVIKTMSPSLLLLLCFFLSFGLYSQGYKVPWFGIDHERCIDRCHDTEEEFSGLFSCLSDCERKYGEEEWGSQGRDPKREREREREQEREHQQGGRGKDPQEQYRHCQQRCQRQEQGEQQQQRCQSRCEEQLREQQEQEQEREREREERDPKQQLKHCLSQCEEQEQSQQGLRQCQQRCEEDQQREQGRERNSQRDGRKREEEQQTTNPYYFHARRFQSRFRTQEGHLRVLQKFTEKSELLGGIKNYRLAIFEANPNTFVVPHHRDADSVLFILRGKGTITFVLQENRESFNLECGDVIRVPAGPTVYLINHDDNERLHIANLIQPVNTPGQFKDYFAVGGENPESYYRVFSNEVLKAAVNTPRDQLERLFGQQRQGFIIRATQEQVQALSQHASSARQTGRSDRGPFNLLNQRPVYSNRFGHFFEASPKHFKQLQDLDVSVSFANIKQGAITMPHYNSRTTTLVLVVEGSGRIEMACPHLSSQSQESQGRREQRQEQEERSGKYQRISASLSSGDVFVVPAGHPVAIAASQNENLRAVGFGINAQNNQRNFLAGRDNIMNQMEREAKDLSFNVPAELVEQIFNKQRETHFAAAGIQQGQQREEGRGHLLASLLDFAGLF